MVSSGDDGALSYLARGNSSYCGMGNPYAPDFPASNPFVVAVVRRYVDLKYL
jgi:subtilase family serine protease